MRHLNLVFQKQRGAVLIVSLVILIAMTLLAITSMKGTSNEVAMAGNLREANLTFQAAEAGLRSAERAVEDSTAAIQIPKLIDEATTDPDYLLAASWDGQTVADIDLASVGIASGSQPKYIIKFVDKNPADAKSVVNTGGGYGGIPKKSISIFRISARAGGQSGQTFRTVQSHFGIAY